MPEATALGLVLNDREDTSLRQTNLASLIQSFNRFILRQLNSELSDTRMVVKPVTTTSLGSSDSSYDVTPARVGQSYEPLFSREISSPYESYCITV